MNEQPASCPRESETVAATRSGVWSSELQTHARTCQQCRSTQLVVSSLERLAAETHHLPHLLPDYRVLWLRAQFQQRQRLARRFEALMVTGGGIIAALIAVIAVIRWEMIANMLYSMTPSSGYMQIGSPATIVVIMVCVALAWRLFIDRTSEHL